MVCCGHRDAVARADHGGIARQQPRGVGHRHPCAGVAVINGHHTHIDPPFQNGRAFSLRRTAPQPSHYPRSRPPQAATAADELVMGFPRNMDGTEGPRAELYRAFAALVEEKAGMPVRLWDERRGARRPSSPPSTPR